jgi:hypothetical protein
MSKKIVALLFIILIFGKSHAVSAKTIHFKIPFGSHTKSESVPGKVNVNLSSIDTSKVNVSKDFYGADSHGFSELPPPLYVLPLQLGYAKLGGSLHATYNWKYNSYFDDHSVKQVYAPLVQRINYIQSGYKAAAMFQVNMLGWQVDRGANGNFVLQATADAEHAANAVRYINGTHKLGLKHIMMGNEPFESEEYHEIHVPTADEYIEKYIDYAVALRRAQEEISGNPNDIKLWGPEINTGWTNWQTNAVPDCIFDYNQIGSVVCSYGNGKFKDFIPYFLDRLTEFENNKIKNPKGYKMLDYLTIHYYSLFRSKFQDNTSILRDAQGFQNVAAMLESTNIWDSNSYINKFDSSSPKKMAPNLVPRFKNWLKQYYPKARFAITEFGIDSVDGINYHPIVRPLYLADFVARAAIAGMDTLINSYLQGGDVSNSWAMIDKGRKTKIYYIYELFTNYFLGDVLESTDDVGDLVNSYTVKTKTGVNVFLVNKDVADRSTVVNFQKASESVEVSQITLPAWSLTVLEVPDNRQEQIQVHQYGAKEMGINPNLKM